MIQKELEEENQPVNSPEEDQKEILPDGASESDLSGSPEPAEPPVNLGLVSVVIPVYNVEQYLSECIDSVLHQSYPFFELLLIDDGSKDQSGSICDGYAAMDDRIRVVHKENEGVSATRNLGIELAKGDYLAFVDSDDYIDEDMLGKMVFAITRYQTDLALCGYERFRDDWREKKRLSPYSMTILQSRMELASLFGKPKTNLMGISIWGKLYRMDRIRAHQIRFRTDIHYEEDCLFNLDYYRTATTAAVLRDCFYHYRQMDNSLSKGYRKNTFQYLVAGYNGRCQFYTELGMDTFPLHTILMIAIKNTIIKITGSDLPREQKLTEYAEILKFEECQTAFQTTVTSNNRLTRLLAKAGIRQDTKRLHHVMQVWSVYSKVKSRAKRIVWKLKKSIKSFVKR